MTETWWIYCIYCKGDGIYVGISNDVMKRYRRHCTGNGALYTKTHPPVFLFGSKPFPSRKDARKEEIRVKKLDPLKKLLYARSLEALSADCSPGEASDQR